MPAAKFFERVGAINFEIVPAAAVKLFGIDGLK
jgi:hypothetical protein